MDMDDNKLTDKEKEFLSMLLDIGDIIIENSNNYYEMRSYDVFDRNEMFNLRGKLGIENW